MRNKGGIIKVLNDFKECGKPVTVFLANGVKLHGKITDIDELEGLPIIALTRDGTTQILNFFQIASICPITDGAYDNLRAKDSNNHF